MRGPNICVAAELRESAVQSCVDAMFNESPRPLAGEQYCTHAIGA